MDERVRNWCDYCGEEFRPDDNRAEIYKPEDNCHVPNSIVHQEPCATYLLNNEGWEIA